MKGITTILFAFAAICFTACSKNNTIPVNGTINGVPAITLYGNSGKLADYILLSTVTSNEEISYNGEAYTYYSVSSGSSSIFITVSSILVVKGTLVSTGSKKVLTVDNPGPSIFSSTVYSSR